MKLLHFFKKSLPPLIDSSFSELFKNLFHSIKDLLFLLTLLFQTGCIHFTVGDSTPQKASDFQYTEPSSPFVSMKKSDADLSWQSKKTGNIIALFSDCSKTSDKPLQLAFNDLLKSFDRLDNHKEETVFYNHREALQVELNGVIDGIAVFMNSILFNKNQCFYQISYSGLTQEKLSEASLFEKFKMEFKAP